MAGSRRGAPSALTAPGAPERRMPVGRRAARSAAVMVRGTISEYTRASRTRRAISWAYWAPKSTTRTVSCCGVNSLGSAAHADVLLPLEHLALGLQRGCDHDLGLLALLERLVAGRRHRGAQGTEQVQGAVVLVGRPDQDLGEGGVAARVHASSAGQGRVKRRHAPVV